MSQTPTFIAYYRVSTEKQGQSGLGLEAQRTTVQAFATRLGGQVVAEFTDIESGKTSKNRPELQKALGLAKARNATLLIARLDRLSRNVNFISGLMTSDVTFLACDNPTANKLTIHIIAAMAEHERELISERTKRALAALKARGVKLGNPQNLTREGQVKGGETKRRQAQENERNQQARRLATELWRRDVEEMRKPSLTRIARELNSSGFTTATGKQFQAVQVQRLLKM